MLHIVTVLSHLVIHVYTHIFFTYIYYQNQLTVVLKQLPAFIRKMAKCKTLIKTEMQELYKTK